MGNLVTPEGIGKMSLEDLIAMDGFRGVDPCEVFGVDFDRDFSELPPHAQSYCGIGAALYGQPLDSWVSYGMHGVRRPEFANFEALTEGLDVGERVRMVVILQRYVNDIKRRQADFQNGGYWLELETLVSAGFWVMDMMDSVDYKTVEACKEAGVEGSFGRPNNVVLEAVVEDVLIVPEKEASGEVQQGIAVKVRRFLNKLWIGN